MKTVWIYIFDIIIDFPNIQQATNAGSPKFNSILNFVDILTKLVSLVSWFFVYTQMNIYETGKLFFNNIAGYFSIV